MKKSVLILLHLLFWLFIGLSLFLAFEIVWTFTGALFDTGMKVFPHYNNVIFMAGSLLMIGACIFYAAYFSLYFFLKRPFRFAWLTLAYVVYTVVIFLPKDWASNPQAFSVETEHYSLFASIVHSIAPMLYFNVCGFLFRILIEWIKDRKIKAEFEKDKLASQLELLKAKIDPHFLFNNLNNIDVFIQEDPKLASDYLKKLSDILRFMLYESNTEKIPLTTEIEYIRKYIDLQKIRTNNLNFVKFEINGDAANTRISPMILIHFIENAFKHAGNKKIEDAVVVRFDISGKHLSFYCKNHISSAKEINAGKNGLGIHLLKQKLDLLYKKEYTFTTKEENNWYIVTLDIQLDEN